MVFSEEAAILNNPFVLCETLGNKKPTKKINMHISIIIMFI
jgi:hypothetical protein